MFSRARCRTLSAIEALALSGIETEGKTSMLESGANSARWLGNNHSGVSLRPGFNLSTTKINTSNG